MESVKGNATTNWVELVVGALVLVSPWLLGFSDITLARWGNVVCGLIIVLVNIWAIYGDIPVSIPAENGDGNGSGKKKLKNNKSRETS